MTFLRFIGRLFLLTGALRDPFFAKAPPLVCITLNIMTVDQNFLLQITSKLVLHRWSKLC